MCDCQHRPVDTRTLPDTPGYTVSGESLIALLPKRQEVPPTPPPPNPVFESWSRDIDESTDEDWDLDAWEARLLTSPTTLDLLTLCCFDEQRRAHEAGERANLAEACRALVHRLPEAEADPELRPLWTEAKAPGLLKKLFPTRRLGILWVYWSNEDDLSILCPRYGELTHKRMRVLVAQSTGFEDQQLVRGDRLPFVVVDEMDLHTLIPAGTVVLTQTDFDRYLHEERIAVEGSELIVR
jgi:hypothetical protein